MAERRMFAKSIVLSDAFLDMPMSARCLYFTLSMFADDDGFVGSPKAIMRQCGSSNDDIAILLQKRFILGFESGVIIIKHWRINNYLQNDRKKQTTFIEELNTLKIDDKNAYTEKTYACIQNVYKMYTQEKDNKKENNNINNNVLYNINNNSITPIINFDSNNTISNVNSNNNDNVNDDSVKGKKIFRKPTYEEVKAYCEERDNGINPTNFVDFYESKGWMIGKNKMKDWKAAVRTWERNNPNSGKRDYGDFDGYSL